MADIHHATMQVLQYFAYDHLPQPLQDVSKPFHDLAHLMATTLPPIPEVTVGLRKLLEAKDCCVRAKLPPLAPRVISDTPKAAQP